MEFREVILSRKSVRSFSDKEVEDESLLKYLNLLDQHPLWQISNVGAIFQLGIKIKSKKISSVLINSWLKNAYAIINACGDPKKSGSRNGRNYYLVDVAISMNHLVLAATDLNLGTYQIGGFNEM